MKVHLLKKNNKKGNNLKKDDIKIVRPFAKGSNPNTLEKLIGKKTIRTIYPNEIIKLLFLNEKNCFINYQNSSLQ